MYRVLEQKCDMDVVAEDDSSQATTVAIEQLHPDVASIDISMANSIEAMHLIKANCPQTAVLALSTREDGLPMKAL